MLVDVSAASPMPLPVNERKLRRSSVLLFNGFSLGVSTEEQERKFASS